MSKIRNISEYEDLPIKQTMKSSKKLLKYREFNNRKNKSKSKNDQGEI